MKFIATLILGGGALVALPNPSTGECAIADIVITRTTPTMIDTDGEITGLRLWQVCGYQVPNDTGGVRQVDDTFSTEYDLDELREQFPEFAELLED